MKYNIKTAIWLKAGLLMLILASVLYACKPDISNPGLGEKPKADFTSILNADGHTILLVNKSLVASMPYWSVPELSFNFKDLKGDSLKVNFIFPGTYSVKMLVAGAGGLDSISKSVTTTKVDPNGCDTSKLTGFLASCTQKVWKLNPAPGAFKCGQFAGEGGWWTNTAQDVIDRSCAFNDTYTFTYNKAGDFAFDDKGDFYSDGFIGTTPSNSCQTANQYTTAQRPWGTGNFKYAITEGTGVKGLGQLKLVGVGAHIGGQKVINNNETPNGAIATSVTYDVWSKKHVIDPLGNYDLLTLVIHFGNWSATEGWWAYTLRSY